MSVRGTRRGTKCNAGERAAQRRRPLRRQQTRGPRDEAEMGWGGGGGEFHTGQDGRKGLGRGGGGPGRRTTGQRQSRPGDPVCPGNGCVGPACAGEEQKGGSTDLLNQVLRDLFLKELNFIFDALPQKVCSALAFGARLSRLGLRLEGPEHRQGSDHQRSAQPPTPLSPRAERRSRSCTGT